MRSPGCLACRWGRSNPACITASRRSARSFRMETAMSENEPAAFRDRLLDAQPMTPALRDEYRKELDELLHHKLTPRTRWLAIGGLMVSVGFAIACVASLIVHHAKPGVTKVVLPTYAAIFLATAAWLVSVLRRGGFARR